MKTSPKAELPNGQVKKSIKGPAKGAESAQVDFKVAKMDKTLSKRKVKTLEHDLQKKEKKVNSLSAMMQSLDKGGDCDLLSDIALDKHEKQLDNPDLTPIEM